MTSIRCFKFKTIGLCLLVAFATCYILCFWPKKTIAGLLIQTELTNEVPIVKTDNFQMTDSLKKWSINKDIFEIEGLYNKNTVFEVTRQIS